MSFWHSRSQFPRARKKHRCQLCQETIDKGHVYETWCSGDSGSVSTVRVHIGCWQLVQQYGTPDSWSQAFDIVHETWEEAKNSAPELVVLALLAHEMAEAGESA